MIRSDYIYYKRDKDLILIEDLNLGNKSVTNDLENVINDIITKEKLDIEKFDFAYVDSERETYRITPKYKENICIDIIFGEILKEDEEN